MTGSKNVFIRLNDKIGTIIASTERLIDDHLIECDGRTICRCDYPEYFIYRHSNNNQLAIPNFKNISKGNMNFYLIARQ